MQPKVYISRDTNLRNQKITQALTDLGVNNPHPDLLFFNDEDKLGMEEAKKIHQHFKFKPFSKEFKILVIVSTHHMTVDAQSSLLKLLEEPPEKSVILIGADSQDSLLPTVSSRCQVIYLDDSLPIIDTSQAEKFISLSLKEKFKMIEETPDKEKLLKSLIYYLRLKLKDDLKLVTLLKELLELEEWAKSGVNMRAILEYLALYIELENKQNTI